MVVVLHHVDEISYQSCLTILLLLNIAKNSWQLAIPTLNTQAQVGLHPKQTKRNKSNRFHYIILFHHQNPVFFVHPALRCPYKYVSSHSVQTTKPPHVMTREDLCSPKHTAHEMAPVRVKCTILCIPGRHDTQTATACQV